MIPSKLLSTVIMKNMAVNKGMKKEKQAKPNSRHRTLAVLLFWLYFAILFYFLFFSEKMGRTYLEREFHYNLIPFYEIRRFLTHWRVLGKKAVLLNLLGNIVAFMPFGFFLPVFSKRCRIFLNTVLYSFELSLFVELVQLVSKVGSFDVDDLLLNTIGGALGFLVYLGNRLVWKKLKNKGNKV